MSVVVIVLPNIEDAKKIKKILESHGFSRIFACASAALALQEISEHSHGLVISGYRLKDMSYWDLAESLPEHFELILLGSPNVISNAGSGILSLATPLKVYELVNTVGMVLRQMEGQARRKRKVKRRSEREDNYIKNAKMLLMERNHLTEEEAHRYIQKRSMDNATNMVETAQMILTLAFEEF